MGVFTTRTLLSSVGVSQSKATPGAIAINWILKVFFFLLIQERTKQVSIMYQNHNSLKEYCRSRGVATMKTSKRKLPVG